MIRARVMNVAEHLVQDVRYAARGLKRSPGFTIVAVATLALGIGATTAVVATADRLLARTPPGVRGAAFVRRLTSSYTVPMSGKRMARSEFSFPEVDALRRALPPTVSIAAYAAHSQSLGDAGAARDIGVTYVLGDYFRLLGVQPRAGRFFAPDEYGRRDLTKVAVISDRLWADRYQRSDSTLGATITIDAHRFTIIGVAAPSFRGASLGESDVWIPYNASGDWSDRTHMYDNPMDLRLDVLLRASNPRAFAAVPGSIPRSLVALRGVSGVSADLLPLANLLDPQRDKGTASILFALAGAAGVILLIACANVATLLLVRSARRRREIAIRFALGVSRARMMAQLGVESMMLAALAGVGAMVIGAWGTEALRRALLPTIGWTMSVSTLWLVGAVGALALVASVATGLLPMLHLRHGDLTDGLRTLTNDGGRHGTVMRAAAITTQTALSVVLLAAAGLFVRSFARAEQAWVPAGVSDVAVAGNNGWNPSGPLATIEARTPEIADDIRRIRGVEYVALTADEPRTSIMFGRIRYANGDSASLPPGTQTTLSVVTPGYFDVMRVPLLRGRYFNDHDQASAQPVMLISKLMAQMYWPGRDPIGQCMQTLGPNRPCARILGIVGDVRDLKLQDDLRPKYYLLRSQVPATSMFYVPRAIVLRTAPSQLDVVMPQVRRLLAGTADVGVTWELQQYTEVLAPELRPWQLTAELFGALACLAALVAGVGIYGVVSYATSQRRREIGVRRALGADYAHVVRLVLAQGMRPVMAGVALGVLLALASGRLAIALLYGESARDPLVLAGAATLLVIVSIAACVVPVRSALGVSPRTVLDAE